MKHVVYRWTCDVCSNEAYTDRQLPPPRGWHELWDIWPVTGESDEQYHFCSEAHMEQWIADHPDFNEDAATCFAGPKIEEVIE